MKKIVLLLCLAFSLCAVSGNPSKKKTPAEGWQLSGTVYSLHEGSGCEYTVDLLSAGKVVSSAILKKNYGFGFLLRGQQNYSVRISARGKVIQTVELKEELTSADKGEFHFHVCIQGEGEEGFPEAIISFKSNLLRFAETHLSNK